MDLIQAMIDTKDGKPRLEDNGYQVYHPECKNSLGNGEYHGFCMKECIHRAVPSREEPCNSCVHGVVDATQCFFQGVEEIWT
jgi:hypothetical protein